MRAVGDFGDTRQIRRLAIFKVTSRVNYHVPCSESLQLPQSFPRRCGHGSIAVDSQYPK